MAVTSDSLLINIQANTESAQKSLDALVVELGALRKELKDTNKSTAETADAVSGLGAGFLKLSGVISVAKEAYAAWNVVMDKTVKAFLQQDTAERQLIMSMQLHGKATQSALDDYREFASGMQNATNASDDMVLRLASVSQAMGHNHDQTKTLITAAVNLSTVLGTDVNSAFEQLMGQYSGVAGRVAKLIPELKNMTEEELRAGKGIELVANQFKGFAEATANTTAGALKRLQNEMGDLAETVGGIVVEMLNLGDTTNETASAVLTLNKSISANKDTLVSLGKTIIWLVDSGVSVLVGSVNILAAALEDVVGVVLRAIGGFGAMVGKVMQMASATAWLGGVLEKLGVATWKAGDGLKELADVTGQAGIEAFKSLGDESENTMLRVKGATAVVVSEGKKASAVLSSMAGSAAADSERVKVMDDVIGKMRKYHDELNGLVMTERQQIMAKRDADLAEIDSLKQKIMLNAQLTQSAKAAAIAELEKGAAAVQQTAGEKLKTAPSAGFEQIAAVGKDAATAITGSFANGAMAMVGGAASMVGMIATAASAVLDMIPGIFSKIAEVINKITDFPMVLMNAIGGLFDAIVRFVSDFIPNLINAFGGIITKVVDFIAESLPDAFVSLIDAVPTLIRKLVEKLPGLIEKLITGVMTALPKIFVALIEMVISDMPKLAIAIAKVIVVAIPKAIINGFINAGKIIISMLAKFFGGAAGRVKLNVEDSVRALKSVSRTLAGETAKLFAVMDLEQTQAAADKAAELEGAIKAATQASAGWLTEMWNNFLSMLQDVWAWVDSNILKPFIDAIMRVWSWVQSSIIAPMVAAITSAWSWIQQNVIAPLKAAFESIKAFKLPTWSWPEIPTPAWIKTLKDLIAKLTSWKMPSLSLSGGKGGGGGIIDTAVSTVSSLFANGGPVYAANGMFVPRGTDTVPAMLTPGEFVVRRDAVSSLGMAAMNQINGGKLPGGSGDTSVTINLDIKTTEPIDENFVRAKLMPRIKDEIRRASLDGAFVVSAAGVRV